MVAFRSESEDGHLQVTAPVLRAAISISSASETTSTAACSGGWPFVLVALDFP